MSKILVTGAAGFIGFHVARRFLDNGDSVFGVDGFTDYYDPRLKRARLDILAQHERYTHAAVMLEDKAAIDDIFAEVRPDVVIHLAAQAGVRYSIEHPQTYIDSNVIGTFNVLEACRASSPGHLLFASTSSVYGGNVKIPFAELDPADHPVSLYAATKRATEALAHSSSHLWDIPTTALRFFTVYGPWGRPDMALFKFVKAIKAGEPIDVYGHGEMRRDFTYIDDLVTGIFDLATVVPQAGLSVSPRDSISPVAPFRVVNIAGGTPVTLPAFISAIEEATQLTATQNLLPMQAGDVVETFADPQLLADLTGGIPSTPIERGVEYAGMRTTPAPRTE
jgi:UDP-glucuronate 4-epimerase